MHHGWRQMGEDWLLLEDDIELGRVHEQILGWSWVVRDTGNRSVMGVAPSRSDAIEVVERRLALDRQPAPRLEQLG